MEPGIQSRAPGGLTRVIIADDYELVRVGLRVILEAEPDLEVVGEAANGREALDLCARLRPDLALLDARMPLMDGLDAAHVLKHRCPALRVIILAMPDELHAALRTARADVDGHMLKGAPRGEIVATVRRVLRGEAVPHGQLSARIHRRGAAGGNGPHETAREQLTPRELDVLRLLAQGQTNLEIAHALSLSRGTVKAYVEQIIAKLRVSSRTHAAVRAVELGLLRTPVEER